MSGIDLIMIGLLVLWSVIVYKIMKASNLEKYEEGV
jgi:hypothetical protein